MNLSAYVHDPLQWSDPWRLDPTQVKTTDIGKIKGWWDKAKDIFDWKENVEKGKAIKKEQDTLMCKAEKEIADQFEREQITPEAAKLALAAKKTAIYASSPVSAVIEQGFGGSLIANAAVSYGYFIALPARNCSILLFTN